MIQRDPNSIMYEITQNKEDIDRLSTRLNNGESVFKNVFLDKPKLSPSELGLLRVVSWFYVHYYEVGKVNVNFLRSYFDVYDLDPNEKLLIHYTLVDKLRTYFQHNLDLGKPRDREIQTYCENWFKINSGTLVPDEDDEWFECLLCFLVEGLEFFDSLRKCIRKIEQDESKDQILRNWEIYQKRYHPPHEFDDLIEKVAVDMGRDYFDHIKFRKRYYDKWVKELSLLQYGYDFEVEARRLIEHCIINDTMAVLPITGNDIINRFKSIEPGPKVGELLEKAKKIYEDNPCKKEELLRQLEHFV